MPMGNTKHATSRPIEQHDDTYPAIQAQPPTVSPHHRQPTPLCDTKLNKERQSGYLFDAALQRRVPHLPKSEGLRFSIEVAA